MMEEKLQLAAVQYPMNFSLCRVSSDHEMVRWMMDADHEMESDDGR